MENLKKCVKSGFPYKLYHLYFSHGDFTYTCVCASMCEMFENLGLIYLVLLGRHYLVNIVRSHFEIQWEKIKYWLKNWWADEELVSSSWTSCVDLMRFTHEISPVLEGLLQRLMLSRIDFVLNVSILFCHFREFPSSLFELETNCLAE